MFRLYAVLIGYVLGCIQTAFIVGKLTGKIDIRDYGSGNAGFTNATRVLGAKAGIVVFLVDFFKVILAFILASIIFNGKGSFTEGVSYLPGIYAGIGAILGHNYPFYLGFKGGKGIACTLGLMLFLNWQIALITYAIGFVEFMFTKYISLASLTMTLLYPIIMIIARNVFGFDWESILSGQENKFSLKKKVNKEN